MKGIKRERVKGRGIERESERKKIERKRRFPRKIFRTAIW